MYTRARSGRSELLLIIGALLAVSNLGQLAPSSCHRHPAHANDVSLLWSCIDSSVQ
jgi:hypothetical protein